MTWNLEWLSQQKEQPVPVKTAAGGLDSCTTA